MHRIWLWPLVIIGIGLSSWAMVEYNFPEWVFYLLIAPIGFAVKLDSKLSGSDLRKSDSVLDKVSGKGDFGLSRGSQIALGVVSLLFALIMFAWASTAPGDAFFNRLPGLFCLLVACSCLLPGRFRGYAGDLIALVVLGIAVWFLATSPWWGSDADPLKFASVYGGLSLAYLIKRYMRLRGNKNT